MLLRKEEEHLCALMLMMSEYMEKRASEGKEGEEVRGWSRWQALNVQPPHITLHHTLRILTYTLLTGCQASFLPALDKMGRVVKWPPCGPL